MAKKFYTSSVVLKQMRVFGKAVKIEDMEKDSGIVGILPVFKNKKKALKFSKGNPEVTISCWEAK